MRPESWRTRGPKRSPVTCPNVLVELTLPDPHLGSEAPAPVLHVVPALMSKSALRLLSTLPMVNEGWLKTLYASARNVNCTCSVIGTFFCNAMFQLSEPGPRK